MVWMMLAGACDTTTFQQVGPGTGQPGGSTGGSGAGTGTYCDRQALDGRCVEFTGPGWDDASMYSSCGATPAVGVCPATKIGGCALGDGAPLEFNEYYYVGAYYSAADATYLQGACELAYGVWL